jgi:hypothetical protein
MKLPRFVLNMYFHSYQIKEDKMDLEYGMNGGGEKFLQNFGEET